MNKIKKEVNDFFDERNDGHRLEIKRAYLITTAKLSDCKIVYSNKDMLKQLRKAKKGDTIIFDEAELTKGLIKGLSKENKTLNKVLNEKVKRDKK